MPRPRSAQVSPAETPYYHCVSRCVRRALLCGYDHETGESYEHRREWIQQRLRLLSSLFTIDICAYAIMSNHYHVVVKLNPSDDLSDEQVIQRWALLFKVPPLVQRYQAGLVLHSAQRCTVADIISVWRSRLANLSWFMKCLNEPIARQANSEDECTGHFWESRFKSQALKSQEALLSCMAYVDLNPVRAGLASTPENSDFTSVQERSRPAVNASITNAIRGMYGIQSSPEPFVVRPLLHFDAASDDEAHSGIPFSFEEYLKLVDWTGRTIRKQEAGSIGSCEPPILIRLKITPENWLINSVQFEAIFRRRFFRAA